MMSPRQYIDQQPNNTYIRTNEVPGSEEAARIAIWRCVNEGTLLHIHKGLYYKGTPTKHGITPPGPIQNAIEIMGEKSVGPTGLTSAYTLGLTTTTPQIDWLVTNTYIPENLADIKISKRNNVKRWNLNYLEIAILEQLREKHDPTTWTKLENKIKQLEKENKINITILIDTAENEKHKNVKQNTKKLTKRDIN